METNIKIKKSKGQTLETDLEVKKNITIKKVITLECQGLGNKVIKSQKRWKPPELRRLITKWRIIRRLIWRW